MTCDCNCHYGSNEKFCKNCNCKNNKPKCLICEKLFDSETKLAWHLHYHRYEEICEGLSKLKEKDIRK